MGLLIFWLCFLIVGVGVGVWWEVYRASRARQQAMEDIDNGIEPAGVFEEDFEDSDVEEKEEEDYHEDEDNSTNSSILPSVIAGYTAYKMLSGGKRKRR